MSHLPLRKENNCLNCGTTVIGRYCHKCGQENIEPKESAWHLLVHFFNDITHFDGRFFSTLKDVLFKPGFLSVEYMKGRRAAYLNPVRMYIFTSFLFFLVFFSVYHLSDEKFKDLATVGGKTMDEIDTMPPADFSNFTRQLNHGIPMSREEFREYEDSIKRSGSIHFFEQEKEPYQSRLQYDSDLRSGKVKDGWLRRQLVYREIAINEKYRNERGKFVQDFLNSLLHHFPQMLFISLPFVALLLKLLYIRRKKFYYVSHAVFTIHLYIFVFIVMLLEIGILQLKELYSWNLLNIIRNILVIAVLYYLYKAMHNFYEERRVKTILKYLVLVFSFFFLIMFLFVIFALVSIFQV